MALTDRTTQAKQDRIRRLYRRQLDGLSARALVYDHAEKEQVSIETAWRDWREVKLLVDEDWQADRDNMLARLQHMRTKLRIRATDPHVPANSTPAPTSGAFLLLNRLFSGYICRFLARLYQS